MQSENFAWGSDFKNYQTEKLFDKVCCCLLYPGMPGHFTWLPLSWICPVQHYCEHNNQYFLIIIHDTILEYI